MEISICPYGVVGERALVVICQPVIAWCNLAVKIIALDAAIALATTIFNIAKANAITPTMRLS
jgi:hypothetical protein